jgi:hypothetical protein
MIETECLKAAVDKPGNVADGVGQADALACTREV